MYNPFYIGLERKWDVSLDFYFCWITKYPFILLVIRTIVLQLWSVNHV
jgi:hypothetical protein